MNSFDEATLRLKQVLGVTKDKAAAEFLGLSPVAWAGRKRRGLFPDTELYALAAKRPELAIDVPYVLSGVRSALPAGEQPASSRVITAEPQPPPLHPSQDARAPPDLSPAQLEAVQLLEWAALFMGRARARGITLGSDMALDLAQVTARLGLDRATVDETWLDRAIDACRGGLPPPA